MTTTAPATTVPTTTRSAVVPTQTVVPTTVAPDVARKITAAASALEIERADVGSDDIGGAPNWLRWLLRFGSYASIFVLLGMTATALFVWPNFALNNVFPRLLAWSSAVLVILAIAQVLVLANDLGGSLPKAILRVHNFDVGAAFIARAFLGLCLLVFLQTIRGTQRPAIFGPRYGMLLALPTAMLVTWAYAGHARSQRWPLLGVPVDVIHHAASATWIGGLAISGLVAVRTVETTELAHVVRRLSKTSMIAVILIVTTGIMQSVRLVGSLSNFGDAGHSRLLIGKLLLVGAMLGFANHNRRLVATGIASLNSDHSAPKQLEVGQLRRTIGVEFLLGIAVIAVTTSLVVRPTSTALSLEPQTSPLSTNQTSSRSTS